MPWHYCPRDRYIITQLWGGSSSRSSSRFRKLVKSLPRPHPDPQLEWHLQLYDQYTKVKRGLEKRKGTPLLSDEDLKDLKIVRGAPLNIDDSHPIDVEKRFFLAKRTRHEWAKWLARQHVKRGGKWPEPEEKWLWDRDGSGNRIPDIRFMNYYAHALWRMVEWNDGHTEKRNPWWFRSGFLCDDPTRATCRGEVYTANKVHEFEAAIVLLYTGKTEFRPDPSVPHIMIITHDTTVPDDRILRSELLLAVSILRSNLALHPWLEYHTFPILVLSFHETGARILQMHTENEHFVVRVSRQLVLPTNDGSIPVDGLIMLTWMLAAPMGDTCFSTLPINGSTGDAKLCQNEEDPKLPSTLKIPTVVDPDVTSPKHRANY